MAVGSIVIYNTNNVKFSNNLLELLGIKNVFFITYVKRLTSPTTYFIHCGLLSAGFTVVGKRLERKVTKHEKLYTLALAKLNSVSELVSKALTDKRISDSEFTIILREVQKYHELKAAIRTGETKTKPVNKETQIQKADLDKLKSELRKEIRQDYQRKINLLTAASKSDLSG